MSAVGPSRGVARGARIRAGLRMMHAPATNPRAADGVTPPPQGGGAPKGGKTAANASSVMAHR